MTFSIIKSILIWSVIAYFGRAYLNESFGRRAVVLRTGQEKRMEELRRHGSSERAQRQMDAHLGISRLEARNREEIRNALGSGAIAVTRNPELSIREMFHGVGLELAPQGSNVVVSVDRFTEFSISIELPRILPVEELEDLSLKIVELGTPFLYRVSFFGEGRLVGELQSAAVTQGGGLGSVGRNRVAQLLVAGLEDPREGGDTTPAEPSSLAGDPADEQLTAFSKTLDEWEDDFDAQIDVTNRGMKMCFDALDLGKLRTKGDVTTRVKALEQVGRDLNKAKGYLSGCLRSLEEKLSGEVDPLVVTITMRELTSRNGKKLAELEQVIPEMLAHQASVMRVLRHLETHAIHWKNVGDGKLAFTNAAALKSFNAAYDAANLSARKLNATIGAIR